MAYTRTGQNTVGRPPARIMPNSRGRQSSRSKKNRGQPKDDASAKESTGFPRNGFLVIHPKVGFPARRSNYGPQTLKISCLPYVVVVSPSAWVSSKVAQGGGDFWERGLALPKNHTQVAAWRTPAGTAGISLFRRTVETGEITPLSHLKAEGRQFTEL